MKSAPLQNGAPKENGGMAKPDAGRKDPAIQGGVLPHRRPQPLRRRMEPCWSSRTRLILNTSANSSRLQQLSS